MRSTWLLLVALPTAIFAQHSVTPSFVDLPANLSISEGDLQALKGEHGNLELRQAVGVVNQNGQAPPAPTQQPAVTVFGMNVAVGNTVTYAMITYTQKFAAVPDQLPTAIPGEIGYGTLTKHAKREATPAPGLPLVIELRYVHVDVPLEPVVRITEVITIPVGGENGTFNSTSNSTASRATNATASRGFTWHILRTASGASGVVGARYPRQ